MILNYTFSIAEATEVTLNSPLLSPYLYENDYESQLWMLFDSNKKYITSGDAYASGVSFKFYCSDKIMLEGLRLIVLSLFQYATKLEKGEYFVLQQVRHESKDMLEKLADTSLLLSLKLASAVTMDAYASPHDANMSKKLKPTVIKSSAIEDLPLYLAPVANDK